MDTTLDPSSSQPTELQQRTCDRCKFQVTVVGLEEQFEAGEFLRIHIFAGHGARQFADGDVWEIDLCQDCAFELLSPHARLIADEDDLMCSTTPLESVVGTIFDLSRYPPDDETS